MYKTQTATRKGRHDEQDGDYIGELLKSVQMVKRAETTVEKDEVTLNQDEIRRKAIQIQDKIRGDGVVCYSALMSTGFFGGLEQRREAPPGEKPEPVRTHLRNMIIVPEMIGSIIGVYNGKTFSQVEIKPEMISHYLAELSISHLVLVQHTLPGDLCFRPGFRRFTEEGAARMTSGRMKTLENAIVAGSPHDSLLNLKIPQVILPVILLHKDSGKSTEKACSPDYNS
ncbi:hypothetical protein OIU77_004053 [Salix suchowensis]|uniref:40S ribosomal protein S15 n=1 Tax=Salix suchowensis TaxID=1278906 RepID=A0ABQ9ATC9_9ROSI|nr:hypothetical protein OIU77_004053 [Salix suchowensis]